jgi:hypothetical protein
MLPEDEQERQPLPSEDSGDLWREPPSGMTDDPLVATQEGVPYDPPVEDLRHEGHDEEREAEASQASGGRPPRDDALLEIAIDALSRSGLAAGDHIQLGVDGSTLIVMGEVESIDVADEITGFLGDISGVDEVLDATEIRGR